MTKKTTESVTPQAGSSEKKVEEVIQKGPSANMPGEKPVETPKVDEINLEDYVKKTQYEDAEKKIGEQGKELGDYRSFFKEISPLLDKLQEQPELVEAIMGGKIDSKLAEAVLADKVKIEEATKVAEAHKEVKKALGTKEYAKTSAKDIEKLVADKVKEHIAATEKSLKSDMSNMEERREFESKVNDFIAKTEDFPEYAGAINEWFEDHPNQYDIEIAYDAVKGRGVSKKIKEEEEAKAAEAQKNMAANAGGGQSQGAQIVQGEEILDKLIKRRSNPNVF